MRDAGRASISRADSEPNVRTIDAAWRLIVKGSRGGAAPPTGDVGSAAGSCGGGCGGGCGSSKRRSAPAARSAWSDAADG
jgi:hypothetical protein